MRRASAACTDALLISMPLDPLRLQAVTRLLDVTIQSRLPPWLVTPDEFRRNVAYRVRLAVP